MAIVDGSDHFYVYICDRCRKILYEGHGKVVKEFITEIGKKGQKLHYCSEECCQAHRGTKAGNGRRVIVQRS